MTIFTEIWDYLVANISSIANGLLPIVVLFLILQIAYLKMPFKGVMKMIAGALIAAVGLMLFIAGVSICFYPLGEKIGAVIATFEYKWMIPVSGLILGFVAALSEPSIRILADQLSDFTSGVIKRNQVIITISIGVAIACAVGMLRLVYGIPIRYFIIPGYVLILGLMFLCDPQYVTMAFDSGGVATGPLPAVFLTAVAIGLLSSISDVQSSADSFGLVALIVMAPIIAMLLLGIVYRIAKSRSRRKGIEYKTRG